jgi:hypothetical protein
MYRYLIYTEDRCDDQDGLIRRYNNTYRVVNLNGCNVYAKPLETSEIILKFQYGDHIEGKVAIRISRPQFLFIGFNQYFHNEGRIHSGKTPWIKLSKPFDGWAPLYLNTEATDQPLAKSKCEIYLHALSSIMFERHGPGRLTGESVTFLS